MLEIIDRSDISRDLDVWTRSLRAGDMRVALGRASRDIASHQKSHLDSTSGVTLEVFVSQMTKLR